MKRKKKKAQININEVDVLNLDLLRRFMSGEGKSARIVSRFVSGLSRKSQSKIATAIKRARKLNLL